MSNSLKVHFMGIGGSGMSAAAGVARETGFVVDGCDVDTESSYLEKIRTKVKIIKGHSPSHLQGKDILVVSPAIYFKYPPESEIKGVKNIMTWEEFVGKYLQKDKEVLAVSGTHGKSTTTAMLSLVFSKAGMGPTCIVGAKVKEWGANYLVGKSNLFIIEADEFNDNFLNYCPEVILLNNIEFDHPDYFSNIRQVYSSFRKHLLSLTGKKILVVNADSRAASGLVSKMNLGQYGIKVFSYALDSKRADFKAKIIKRTAEGAVFEVVRRGGGAGEVYKTKLAGDFNVLNTLGVIAVSSLYSVEPTKIKMAVENFNGIGRRLELVGEKRGVFVYDDYAHHPTAIRETIKAVKQKHPVSRIFAVVEPHSYSRVKALLKGYADAFTEAYSVVVAPIFKARDSQTFGVDESLLAKVIKNDHVWVAESFEEIANKLAKELKDKDVVLVMGAGRSSGLASAIVKEI